MVYVPVYSHIYHRNQNRTFNLATTLSICNADPYSSFTISRVGYYDSRGKLVQRYIDSEVEIDPLASTSYVIEESDLRGGVQSLYEVLSSLDDHQKKEGDKMIVLGDKEECEKMMEVN